MFIIFGIDTCPYCRHAKSIIQSGQANGEYHDVTSVREQVVGVLKARCHVPQKYRTVPIVFKNGQFIGGRDDMLKNI